ncbi:unnamed protein product [Schistocephalus solidus]|nr:unnamed protein product [Schistocephalus solidus]
MLGYSTHTSVSPPVKVGTTGVQLQSPDLTVLYSALEDRLSGSIHKEAAEGRQTAQVPLAKRSILLEPCYTQFGEWASRPEISETSLLPIITRESTESESCATDEKPPWRLRHSRIWRLRLVGWLLRHFPFMLGHVASFLLGAVTMCLLLKKRVKLPILGPLSLE